MMTIRKPTKPVARAPQRSNGVKRREAIMSAAADIISESGIAGLTLHATARRAKSSVGSMYHFFSDKDQLLDALRDQHRQAMDMIMAGTSAISPAEWQGMNASDVVSRLFGRPIHYYSEHPFALQLHELHEGQAIDDFLSLVETVMTLRLGEARGRRVARLLYAISTGTLSFVLDVSDTSQRVLVSDIPAVLTAYLATEEAAQV